MIIGIDVSKEKLDICAGKKHWQSPNLGDYQALIDRLRALPESVEWVILEPTGGYELSVAQALTHAGLRVARPHVGRMSHHARSRKLLSKTDKLDAEALAHFGQSHPDQLKPFVLDEAQEALRQLWQRRQQLVEMKVMEENRRQHLLNPRVLHSHQVMVETIEKEIEALDVELRGKIDQERSLKGKKDLLLGVKGIGEKTAHTLLAMLPELGRISHKALGALVGVVPVLRQSGHSQQQPHIAGGRKAIRHALYLPTLSACRSSGVIRDYYLHLIEMKKAPKQAIIACMHKLLRIANAMLRDQKPFAA